MAPGIGATRYCTQQGTIGVAGATFQANDPTQFNGQQSYLDGLQRFIHDSTVALPTPTPTPTATSGAPALLGGM